MKTTKKTWAAAVTGCVALALPAVASAAPASTSTVRDVVQFTEPSIGPCDGAPGWLTVDATILNHQTGTGSTFNEVTMLQGAFTFEPEDPAQSVVSGHFVDRYSVQVNFGQLKDARQRLMTRAVGVDEEGNRIPVIVTTVTHFGADGSVEVLVDEVRCGDL